MPPLAGSGGDRHQARVTAAEKLLERMRANPRGDWQIGDVERVCRAFDVAYHRPGRGSSHVTLSHPSQAMILTVPSARPIKPVYIAKLVSFIDSVIDAAS